MLSIVVLLGGNSPEKEVSLTTGKEISEQLKQNGHKVTEIDPAEFVLGHDMIKAIHDLNPDLVFIGLHGGDGENGVLQALLSGSKIPYTGSQFKASAIAMDKLLSKHIADQVNVLNPNYIVLSRPEYVNMNSTSIHNTINDFIMSIASSKVVIKPVDAGSSVGVHILPIESDLDLAINDAFLYSDHVLMEEYIDGRELTVTILDGNPLPVVEIIPHDGFYDYPNKYTKGNTTYIAPAKLTPSETSDIQNLAVKIWHAMGCRGYARIDFRYDGKVFYFLEVNTLPGMTPLSLTPMAAKALGMDFGTLLDKIIDVALASNN